ncbi:MAG: TonB-dependent receptor [Bacteroidetes bacterium]|jgi:iron complex outermembrane receptor protein|nr:TonB-dependent receptor [Bacteroidota bacterium]MDF1867697.1 TonB-dependent receptor [Saprospiraceae bacterium]
MHKLIAFSLSILSLSLFAQDNPPNIDLPNIVIKENRLELPFSDVSRSVNIITKAQIKNLPVQSVPEILSYIAGVDIRQRGAHGVQADVGIRGGGFDQVLILVNGIKLIDPQTGHHLLNLPFDTENIERIEVLKGPGARIYGQNAFAGAINIVTKVPNNNYVKIGAQAGQNGLGGGNLSVALAKENFQQYFSVSKDFSDGYRHNTDYDITNYFYQNNFQSSVGNFSLIAGHTEREFGANGFYASPDFTEQYEEVKTSLLALQHEVTKGNWTSKTRFFWRQNKDDYIFVRENPSLYHNIHKSNVLGIETHTTYQSKLGITGLGVEVNKMYLESNNLGDQDRLVLSAFAEHRFQFLDRFDITPGVSLNDYSDFGTQIFPGIDIGVTLKDNLKLFGNAGYTWRIPTFTDLFYEDPSNEGNPDLQPEEAFSYEGGIKWSKGGIQIQASYFNRNSENLIDWTKVADTLRWKPNNLNEVTMSGLDISADLFFPILLNSDTWLQRLNIGYTYIDADVQTSESAISRYVLENLKHQFVLGFEYRIGQFFFHNIRFRYSDRASLEDYSVVDSKFIYRKGNTELFLEATNLFDTDYKETNLVPMPGRWVKFGGSYRFEL